MKEAGRRQERREGRKRTRERKKEGIRQAERRSWRASSVIKSNQGSLQPRNYSSRGLTPMVHKQTFILIR